MDNKQAENLGNAPDSNPHPVLQVGQDGCVRYHNKASDPILKAWSLVPGKSLTGDWLELVQKVLDNAEPRKRELQCNSKFYRLNFVPVTDLSYVYIYGSDITGEKKVQAEIESLAKFPSENPNPVLRVSQEGRIIYANAGSSPLLKSWKCEVNDILPDRLMGYAASIYESGIAEEIEIDVGDQIFLVMFSPVKESGYTCLYGRDITELKSTQQDLQHALEKVKKLKDRLNAENVYLQDEIKEHHNCYELITVNSRFREICEKIDKVAPTDASVLIFGETGTGKELLARALHSESKRRDRPLVTINCAALPANLIESELFGHEKGAFTGAHQSRMGRFEIANEGTIFLDEIGELPLELQPKLLRVLQEGKFERLGGYKTISVDVRVVAATNRNLEEMVRNKEFREDLYYRLSVFPIETIPLRSRKEDIPVLIDHFVKQITPKIGKEIRHIPETVMEVFIAYDWPGNVRELENVIERAIILSNGDTLELHENLSSNPRIDSLPNLTLKEMEQRMIKQALDECQWIIQGNRGAAKRLDIPPSTLRARIKEYGLKKPNF